MDQSQPVDHSLVRRPHFWVGPLLAGCCFAMGFGIADRVVSLQTDQNPAPTQRFAPSLFPGDSLQTLRSIHQDDANLQVDFPEQIPSEVRSGPRGPRHLWSPWSSWAP